MKRLIARLAVITAIVASSLTITAPVTLAAGVNTADTCKTTVGTILQRGIGTNTGTAVIEMSANVLVRNVWHCHTPAQSPGFATVLPVNMENGSYIIQLGYGRDDIVTGGQMRWLFTPNTCSGGKAYVVPGSALPIDGHSYRLTIKWIATSNRWRAYIDDAADGLGNPVGYWYNDGECMTYGRTVWAGFETHDQGDMMGGSLWTPITAVDYSDSSADYSLTSGQNFQIGSPWPSQYHTEVYNSPSPFDAVRAYTS